MSNDHWYTPEWLTSAMCPDGIDLDPASCVEANKSVKAKRYYDSGSLEKPWECDVLWLNPPYSNPAPWVDKLVCEYSQGSIGEAYLLINSSTSTRYYHKALSGASALLLFKKRIAFWSPGKSSKSPRHDNSLFYFGKNPLKFAKRGVLFGVAIRFVGNTWSTP